MDKKKVLGGLFFIGILAVSVWLRFLYIDTPFWYDEACSWVTAKKDFPLGIIDNLLKIDLQHTPLYFFLLHFWMKLFGEGETSIRILSVIFGIATVPLAYVVSRKLVSNILAFLITSIIAVSPLLVFFSVEARMYPIAVFLVLLSLNYLVDFENKGDLKSLIKLAAVNVLIPYTFVGGILYNISLAFCYGFYLFRNSKERFWLYLKGLAAEVVLLAPYFVLLSYYAKMRNLFIVKHEGVMVFPHLVEAVRNFFGITLVNNLYWPSVDSYVINFTFTVLVIVPCVYFMYGFIQGCRDAKGFRKVLYTLVVLNFIFFILLGLFQVNVFTVRYFLYLLPPLFILSIIGLSNRISLLHLKVFTVFFTVCAASFTLNYVPKAKEMKMMAFKAVEQQAQELNLNADDIVIMPFGADAPYYFRFADRPRVLDFDFHKEARNPNNDKFYDKTQQKSLITDDKYQILHDAIFQDKIISDNFYKYFVENVNTSVRSGRYVLVAFYGQDAASLVTLKELRSSIDGVRDVKDHTVDVLLKKFVFDIRFLLDYDFNLVNSFTKDNYTYLLYQKR